jgi:beta-glucosidase/6-phospho-beta-glucosidase/beta-galactosidase
VPVWFTINEPQYCNWQFSLYPVTPYYPVHNNVSGGLKSRYLCGHYTVLAHAKVAKWYKNEFKGTRRMTFKHSGNYFEPETNEAKDVESQSRNFDFVLGWFQQPVIDGDYPASMRQTLGDLLPPFTAQQKELLRGSCDFFALDGYTASVAFGLPDVSACIKDKSHPDYPECAPTKQSINGFAIGPAADSGVDWLKSTPDGIRKLLGWIKNKWPSIPDIVVAEFGFAEPFENQLNKMTDIQWDLRRSVS